MSPDSTDYNRLEQSISVLNEKIDAILAEIKDMSTNLATSHVEVEHLKADIAELKTEIKEVKREMAALEDETIAQMNTLKARVNMGRGMAILGGVMISAAVAIVAAFIGAPGK